MSMPSIKEADFKNKRILMRVDFNVPFKKDELLARHKLLAVKETLDFILSHDGVKLAILSHLGRPESKDEKFSFSHFYSGFSEILGVDLVFIKECCGSKVQKTLDSIKENQVLMLENVRFFKEDSQNSKDFSKNLADGFDIFVNEAFGVAHREHSSTTGILDFLPGFLGLNFQKEIEELLKLRSGFEKPALALIGGAKIQTKLPVIEFFSKNYDVVLLGGKMGIQAEKKNMVFADNVIFPDDYEGEGKDIGAKTINKFAEQIKKAKTIVWNGPLGLFEERPFDMGTRIMLNQVVKNKNAFKVAGGGETAQVLEEEDVLGEFDFVSTGGGAMLEFLAKGTLPVLEAFKEKNK